jgi:hypothetical protein
MVWNPRVYQLANLLLIFNLYGTPRPRPGLPTEDSIPLNPYIPHIHGRAASGPSFQGLTFLQLNFNVEQPIPQLELPKPSPLFTGFVVTFRWKLGWKDAGRESSLFIDFILDMALSFFR